MDILIDPYRYKAALKLTSKPYPARTREDMAASLALLSVSLRRAQTESAGASLDLISGDIERLLETYDGADPELAGASLDLAAGDLYQLTNFMSITMPTEQAGASMTIIEGNLEPALVSYTGAEDENVGASITLVSGSLT